MQINVSPLMSVPSGFCLTHNNTHISSVTCAPSHINISLHPVSASPTHTCSDTHENMRDCGTWRLKAWEVVCVCVCRLKDGA